MYCKSYMNMKRILGRVKNKNRLKVIRFQSESTEVPILTSYDQPVLDSLAVVSTSRS